MVHFHKFYGAAGEVVNCPPLEGALYWYLAGKESSLKHISIAGMYLRYIVDTKKKIGKIVCNKECMCKKGKLCVTNCYTQIVKIVCNP